MLKNLEEKMWNLPTTAVFSTLCPVRYPSVSFSELSFEWKKEDSVEKFINYLMNFFEEKLLNF